MITPLVLMPSEPTSIELDACAHLELLKLWEEPDTKALLEKHGQQIVAIASCGHGAVGAALFDQLPNLQIVAHFGVGYENVDVEGAIRRGIVVTNVAGSNQEETADTAMGLLLMTVRELGRAEQHLRQGRWKTGNYPLTELSLQGSNLGMFGIGRIGTAIARRAEAFGLTVSYHARHRREDLGYRFYDSLQDMARDVDILVVAVPARSETHHAIDADVLTALGPQGVLINVARGSVVNEPALIDALREGRLKAAGLDVYESEPDVPVELIDVENAVLLPHVGSASVPTRQQMAELGAANLASWLADGIALTPVAEVRDLQTPGSELR